MSKSLPYLEADASNQWERIDENCLAQLIKRHLGELTYFSFQIVRNIDISEEIASEAFLKLWNNKENLLQPNAAKSYLFVTAKNASLDYIRRLKVMHQREQDIQNFVDSITPNIEEAIIRTELVSKLYQAIQSLAPQYQQVVRLEYLEGLSLKEIATSMKISVNTVKTYRARGLMKLRKWLSAIPLLV
jgi:RNA polymerase sigma-70 factor (family 1)